jgi:hypothetical protein
MCTGGLTRNLGRMFATTPTRFFASMAAAFALVAGAAQASPVKDPPAAAGPAVAATGVTGAPAERVWHILPPQPMPTPTPRPVR